MASKIKNKTFLTRFVHVHIQTHDFGKALDSGVYPPYANSLNAFHSKCSPACSSVTRRRRVSVNQAVEKLMKDRNLNETCSLKQI